MTLCVFVLIASEFLPVSLLTPIARDLGVTEGRAGQGIAISGALAVLTSLSLSTLAGNVNRKYLLLGMTILMAISGLVIALASSYLVYMTGRAMIGIAIGGFWSMSAATAMRLVPEHQVTRALAIFNGGNALATVVAAPLGSYLGATIGWRGAFLCLVPVAVVAFIWQCICLPGIDAQTSRKSQGSVFHLFRRRMVAVGMLACGVFFMGQFTLFTYVRPFLESVTRVNSSGLSLILLAIGVAGFVGTLIVAIFLNAKFYPTLVAIPLLMAVIAMTLILTGHRVWVVGLLLGFWGLLATAAPTGWWTWIARALPDDAEAGGGLMVAVIQFSIALGSTVGGMVFDHLGWQSTFALSGLLLIAAAALTFLTSRQQASTS
ncbi:MFS transporter [Salmonella enterica]|uniref:MFS transporter n=1 Tax=Salmonella enterica TaxID=28901 RepID=A0A3J5QRX2_SALER|nr:MFS transporter [Salmonella enterica]ECU4767805.1 MFS transporter [Salmonella enterica subsp. enterica]EDQ1014785.1 MFS transporter [Salmonella enterica subsp. houtenae serovar 50:z4,z23:-]EDV3253612.1 MFS transporter [Salmonella enterica subsp. houtenae]EDW0438794.1 MFS transporter [Salmonella enterica subsp. arizonae serovar 50:z4,z23:-]HAE7874355.1 MFS transporter [Salmonella enterica subsp. enterica serovar 1,9,12:-:-]HCZ1709214.1 MFS transporter [Salmonella enterica subsp. enterica se